MTDADLPIFPPLAPAAASALPSDERQSASPSRSEFDRTTLETSSEHAADDDVAFPTSGQDDLRLGLEDPLTIGGQLYLSGDVTAQRDQKVKNYVFESVSLLDLYVDARVSERLRGYSLFRVGYTALSSDADRRTSIGAIPVPSSRGLSIGLDQMWLSFDAFNTVFVTVGKVHDRWGVGQIWTPSDYLHVVPLDPLAIIDTRPGTGMVKFHVPVESLAWNFYAYLILDGPDFDRTLSRVAGAARAVIVLGPAELGIGVFARRNHKVVGSADVSFGIGRIDVYGEIAMRDASSTDRVRFEPDPDFSELDASERPSWSSPAEFGAEYAAELVEATFPRFRTSGYAPQVVAGARLNIQYGNSDVISLGAEYFFNDLGYDSTAPYPGLVLGRTTPLVNPASYFYIGKHYAAITLALPAPGSWEHSNFAVSTIGNLSDRSFVTRLNYNVAILVHLQLDAYVAVRYGRRRGEFRAGARFELGDDTIHQEPTLLDLGIALRLAL